MYIIIVHYVINTKNGSFFYNKNDTNGGYCRY